MFLFFLVLIAILFFPRVLSLAYPIFSVLLWLISALLWCLIVLPIQIITWLVLLPFRLLGLFLR